MGSAEIFRACPPSTGGDTEERQKSSRMHKITSHQCKACPSGKTGEERVLAQLGPVWSGVESACVRKPHQIVTL
jgi:hypothetical protein